MNFKPYLSQPCNEFMHLLQSLAWVSIIHWVIVWCLTPYRQYVSYCQPYKGVSIIILRIIDWLSDWLIDWLIDWLNRILRHIGNISAIQQRIWVCVITHTQIRCWMAEILPICRKILFNQSINQSINQSLNQSIILSIIILTPLYGWQ